MAQSELEQAKVLIQAKRYEDARALLLTIDHPTADKWLSRLNEMSASNGAARSPVVAMPPQSFTGKLILTIVLLFVLVFPGLIALTVFSKEAKAAQLAAGQKLPGADALINLNKYIFWVLVAVLILVILYAVFVALRV